jgi:neurofibromin 1
LKYRNNRPFWEADEVDVAVVSAALASIYRILPEEEAISLFQTCMEPEQSPAVKVCAIQACIMLTIEVCTFKPVESCELISSNRGIDYRGSDR